jgi:hypothetical protein
MAETITVNGSLHESRDVHGAKILFVRCQAHNGVHLLSLLTSADIMPVGSGIPQYTKIDERTIEIPNLAGLAPCDMWEKPQTLRIELVDSVAKLVVEKT